MVDADHVPTVYTCGFRIHLKRPLPSVAGTEQAVDRLAAVVGDGVVMTAWPMDPGRVIHGAIAGEQMPRNLRECCRRRSLVDAFAKHEFQRKERPPF
eukprot:3553884-Pyramimonas_sp.AAC.1